LETKNGGLAMNTKESRNMEKYFDKLLNTEEPKESIKIGSSEINEVEVELTVEYVKNAMRNLKKTRLLELIEYFCN
jgi:hypothetical protein